jgi:hypothetical protein
VYFDFMRFLRHENGNLKKKALIKLKAYVSLILSIFLDKKSSQYFWRKTHLKLAFLICGCVGWGGVAIFEYRANGGGGRGRGGRRLVF